MTTAISSNPFRPTRRSIVVGAAASIASIRGAPAVAGTLLPEAELQLALEAYVYGYSLVISEITRVQMTNLPNVSPSGAPMGQFLHVSRYPTAEYRGISAPNVDTLYSVAWVDLAREPMVFSHPDMGSRFYMFPMVDLWMTIVASPGTRTAGGKAALYLLTGPGWSGAVPAVMTQVKSATRYLAILGRTYADGTPADYKTVNALQANYRLFPLSAFGKPSYAYTPPVIDPDPGFSLTAAPQDAILALDAGSYFSMMTRLMGDAAPPPAEDAPILERMARIGIVPGQPFDGTRLSPGSQRVLQELPKAALRRISGGRELGTTVNGWSITKGLGTYGTDYAKRAAVAAFGWPANLQADAVYPVAQTDGVSAALTGANKYTLTFPKGGTPPVSGFWSLTMYLVDKGWWFVPNPLNKFAISARDSLAYNADGSLTLLLQSDSPGKGREANWLPAPKGEFVVMLRLYWPKPQPPSILDGSWTPPAILQVA